MTKKYWNKRKRYGWGWTPTTLIGWLFFAAFVIAMVIPSLYIAKEDVSIWYLVYVAVLVAVFILVTVKVSPKPKWRWGKKPTDNEKEDF